MKRFNGITNSMDMSLSKLQEIVKTGKPGMLQSTRLQRVRHDLATEQVEIMLAQRGSEREEESDLQKEKEWSGLREKKERETMIYFLVLD